MKPPIDWLLEGAPWIQYRTRRDLLSQAEDHPAVVSARKAMLADDQVKNLLKELANWPGTVISSHKSAGQPFHKLTFVADLGLKSSDPEMADFLSRVFAHQSDEGPFQLPINVPTNYGGTGKDQWGWALCDAPLIEYALVKLGLEKESNIKKAAVFLVNLTRENGWPCVVSKELGKFRGPGRKDDPCPFATLIMLKVLAEMDEWRDSVACRVGAETLLGLWSESTCRHPYMFFMGTDFRKLKVPFVWYDLIHVLDVLSNFGWLSDDPRLLEMLAILEDKIDLQGRLTLDSVWTAWKNWEFGQKKEPSRWLTLLGWRIITRVKAF